MALTEDNILGSFLPNVQISRAIVNEGRIDLTLMVIDNTIGEEITSFLNERFLQEAVVIKILQSTSQDLTKDLLNAENVIIPDPYRIISFNSYSSMEIGASGEKIYYYDVSYIVDTNLAHISYVVFSEINASSQYIQQELGINFTQEDIRTIPKKITIDTIINNSQIETKSYNYLLDDGTLWLGEVVVDEGKYETLEENPRNINVVEVPNYKIQDFRVRRQVAKNIVDQRFYDATTNLLNLSPLPSNSTLPVRKPAMFGDINKIINSDKTICLSLFINIEQIILQHCLYPNIFNRTMLDSVSSISFYRRKIKSINESEIIPEENDIPIAIDTNFRDNRINLGIDSVNYYLLKDSTISRIYEGTYQYGIKISFTDPTINELKNRLIILNSIRKSMLEYYKTCELYNNSQTNYFKPIISSLYSENKIRDENILPYLDSVSDLNSNFDRNRIQLLLESNLNTTNGSLDGISIFLKMIDDAISDISNLLSIANITPELLSTDPANIERNTAKEMIEQTFYFKEAVHNASDYNKIELGYLNVKDGIVSFGNLRNSLYTSGRSRDELYIAPLYVDINDNKFYLQQLEDSSEEGKKQKFLLLKNKILEVELDKSLYTSLDEFSITKKDSGNKNAFILQLISQNNKLMENNLFSKNSVVFTNLTDPVSRTYDQFNDINAVLYPKEFIQIPSDKTSVNILKNLVLDMNSEEHLFKYRLLNKIEYATYDSNTSTSRWESLIFDSFKTFKDRNVSNILCRLVKYDYSSIENLNISNINNFNYNNTFILDLNDVSSENLFRPTPSTFQETRINLATNVTQINFNDVEIGKQTFVEIQLRLINNDEVNDIYCEIQNPRDKNSYFRIERNKFDLYFNKPEKIRIYFRPEQEISTQTNLMIYSLNKNQLLKVQINANSIKQRSPLTTTPPYSDTPKSRLSIEKDKTSKQVSTTIFPKPKI